MRDALPRIATMGVAALLLAAAAGGCAHQRGTPYRQYISDNLAPGMSQTVCPTTFYTVPAGQRLVIEYVSMWGVSQDMETANVSLSSSGAPGKYIFFLQHRGTSQIGHALFGENQQTWITFEPGEEVSYCVARDKNAVDYGYRIQLAGKLVPVP